MRRTRLSSSSRANLLAQLFCVVEHHPVTGRAVLAEYLPLRDATDLADRCAASRPTESMVQYRVETMVYPQRASRARR
jgi:hypothetical protein